MGYLRGRRSQDSVERGLSSVVGYVLLLLLVVGGVSTLLVIGGEAIGDVENQAEIEHVETAFTQLDAKAAMVALGETESQTVDLGIGSAGAFQTDYTGTMTITQRLPDGTEVNIVNQTLGTITYENHGETIAYQGGGVWRGTGRSTMMVSPPELHYRDETLTLPIIAVSPGKSTNQVTVREKYDPVKIGPGEVQNSVMVLTIQSEYYVGWKTFFEERIEHAHVTVDHEDQVITVELGRTEYPATFNRAITIESGNLSIGTGNAVVDGPIAIDGELDESGSEGHTGGLFAYVGVQVALDPLIERVLAEARDNPTIITRSADGGDGVLRGGNTYLFEEGIPASDTLRADLSGGNVTAIVSGDINGSIVAENASDHHLRIFTTGHLSLSGAQQLCVDPCTPGEDVTARNLQLFGTAKTQVAIANGAYFEGVIYAPRGEHGPVPGANPALSNTGASIHCSMPDGSIADVCIAIGNAHVDGSITAGPASITQSSTVRYDPNLSEFTLNLTTSTVVAPPLSFLHISVNTVTVDGPTGVGKTATPPTSNGDIGVTPVTTSSEESIEFELFNPGSEATTEIDLGDLYPAMSEGEDGPLLSLTGEISLDGDDTNELSVEVELQRKQGDSWLVVESRTVDNPTDGALNTTFTADKANAEYRLKVTVTNDITTKTRYVTE